MTKICVSCHEEKPVDQFHKRALSRDGLRERCVACVSYYNRLIKYGVSAEQFDTMYLEQNGVCAVRKESEAVAVDHDHATGRIRGLLCNNCNRGIGLLGDDAERLKAAFQYLENECLGN